MIKFLNKIKGKKEDKKEDKKEEEKEKKEDKKEEKKEEKPKTEKPKPQTAAKPAAAPPAQMPMYPYPFYPPQQAKTDDKAQKTMSMELEKMKALMTSFSEAKRDMDEKLRSFAESLGEIRSMFFQREQSIKDIQVKVEEMSDVVTSLKPEKLAEERRGREKETSLLKSKIERLDKVTSDLLDRFAEIRETLEGLKSLKTIVDISKDVGEKLLKIEDIETKMEKMSSKLETTYLELNKALVDLPLVKSRTQSLDKLSKELMSMVEENKRNIEQRVTKKEAAKVAPSAPEGAPPLKEKAEDVEALKKKRDEIKKLMETLEKEFKDATITEKSYKESMDKSQAKLKEIEDKIGVMEKGGGLASPIKKGISRLLRFGRKKKKEEAPPEGEPKPEEGEVVGQSIEMVPEKELPPEVTAEEAKVEEDKKQVASKIRTKEVEQKLKPAKKPADEPQPKVEKSEKPKLEKKLKKVVETKKKKDKESKTKKEAKAELLKKLKLK